MDEKETHVVIVQRTVTFQLPEWVRGNHGAMFRRMKEYFTVLGGDLSDPWPWVKLNVNPAIESVESLYDRMREFLSLEASK